MNKNDDFEEEIEKAIHLQAIAYEKHKENISLFIDTHSPKDIEAQLNEYIIGQPQLTKYVADFIFYHAFRQRHPELPTRPLLIAGPSGSGKTEVWRVANKLYGDIFKISIADGSKITIEGWAGGYKLNAFLTQDMSDGILVVDEFDKLTKPKHNTSGDNIAYEMQAEFLKLVEGEYVVKDIRNPRKNFETRQMGIVLVGAFEDIRKIKSDSVNSKSIGFGMASPVINVDYNISSKELIEYGVTPELVGRISQICTTKSMSDEEYLEIIKNPNSRIGTISKVLKEYDVNSSKAISDSIIMDLIDTSKSEGTGIRWVSAQLETKLLNELRNKDFTSNKHYKYSDIENYTF